MANSTLEKTIDDFYEKLDGKDEVALKRIAVAHQRTIDKLGKQLAIVTAKIEDDISKGLDSGTYFLQQKRLAAFITQAEEQFQHFGTQVGLALTASQKDVVNLAGSFVEDSIIGSNGIPLGASFGVLPEGAIQQFVGTLGDGSPVRSLTESFGAEASKTLNNLLLTGISTGIGPLEIAKQMAAAVPTMGLPKANTIARTEMMRAFRGATNRHMVENKDILKGWKWYCALDRNTCPVCWAEHGGLHKVTELMATHPNCRCVQIPVTKTWKELGYDVEEPALSKGMSQSGEQLFSGLDEVDQQFILGKAGFTGYKNGLFELKDFVQDTYSPEWGFGKTTRSISDMVGKGNVRSLTQGKIPNGLSLNPTKLELPPSFDPLHASKKYVDDAFANGKLPQSDYDKIKDLIDTGSLNDADDIEALVNKIYDIELNAVNDLLEQAKNIQALSDKTIANIKYTLDQGPSITKLDELNTLIQEDIKKKVDIIKAEFDEAIEELAKEINKAYDYGSSNSAIIDDIAQKVMDGSYATKQEVIDATKIISNEVKLNDPYIKLTKKMDDAVNLNPNLQYQASAIDVNSLTIQEAKDQIDVWDDLIKQNIKLDSNTTFNHPKFNDLTQLYNDGKITQTEYQTLVKEGTNGLHTNKTFTEAVEQLETKAATKVTKTSQQLLSELDQTGYPQYVKDDLASKYKSKTINKEQMQSYIDSAPKPTQVPSGASAGNAPSPIHGNWANPQEALTNAYDAYKNGTIGAKEYNAIQKVYYNIGSNNPWGKYVDNDYFFNYVEKKLGIKPNATSVTKKGLPYKKHMVDLDDMLKSGAIDQNTYDDILLKFAQGKYKNKQVEQLINNFKIAGGQQGGSTYVAGSIDVRNFYWDYDGWIRSRGAANNRANFWTTKEQSAIRHYTSSGYTDINRGLRAANGDKTQLSSYTRPYVDSLDDLFTHTRLQEDVKVFRNTSVQSTSPWANPKVGDILTDQGFTSSSVQPNWSGFKYGSCAKASLEIIAVVRQGTKAAWVKPISSVPHEDELLINRGNKFVVTHVEEIRAPGGAGCAGDYRIYGEYIP